MPKSQKRPRLSAPGTSREENSRSLNASFARKNKFQTLLERGVSLSEHVENTDNATTLALVKSLIENTNAVSIEKAEAVQDDSPLNASETLMDTYVVKIGHEIVGTVAHKLGKDEFDEKVYAEKILSIINDGSSYNWALFAEMIVHTAKTPRFSQSLLGTFDFQSEAVANERRKTGPRRKTTIAELKQPERVRTLQEEENSTELLSVIKEKIETEFARRQNTPLPYYEVICDPTDFMHTIDNAFQVSFLIRDGFLGLAVDRNNQPTIYVPTKEQVMLKEREKKAKQAVVGLTYHKWLQIKESFSESILS